MHRVLLVAEGSRYAGIEAHLINLAQSSIAAETMQFSFAFFDDGPLYKRIQALNLPAFLVERRGKYDTRAFARLALIIKEQQIDAVHAHGYLASVVAGRACGQTGIPLIASVHGQPEPYHGVAELKMRLNLWLERRVLRKQAAKVITVASFLRDALVKRGVPAEKIVVIHNGILDRPPDPVRRDVSRLELRIDPHERAVAFVGRLDPIKDPLLFADFAARLNHDLPNTRFLVAGNGPLMDAMRARVNEAGLSEAFMFLGFVEDLDPIYAASDLVVFTSQSEGVPNVALEAMRAATPVLSPSVGGMPDILDGLPDLLAPSRDAVTMANMAYALFKDQAHTEEIGRLMRERFLERFTAARMARDIVAIYHQACSEGK